MRRLALVALVASLLAFAPAEATGHWALVGTHPDAAAQPTERGRELRELHGFSGRVYVGFGDYGANTGPIKITPWNPSTGWENEGSQDTEAIYQYQQIGQILFSPSIDPAYQGALELPPNASDYASINGLRQWPDSDRFESFHVFDIRQLGDSMIASGSGPGCNLSCGRVWRSDNGGASWYSWYSTSRDASQVWGGDRCYAISTHGGRVWADCTAGDVTWTGSQWVGDSSQRYAHTESVTFGGYLVSPGRGGNLYGWNGSERILRSGTHKWLAVDGSNLYAVDAYNRVYRTSDLSSWTQVTTVPSEARSFTAAAGVLYYGDATSRLWSMGVASTSTTSSTTTTTTASTTTSSTTSSTTTTTTAPARRCFLGLLCTR